MMNEGMLAIMMLFGVPMVAIIGGIFLVALKILKGEKSKGSRMNGNEAKVIQEVFNGLERMEKRIEALEIIVFDKFGEKKQ